MVSTSQQIASVYFAAGLLWVLLSDKITGVFLHSRILLTDVYMVNGFVFVSVSAVLIYFLLKRRALQIAGFQEETRLTNCNYQEIEERLRLFIEHAPVSLAILDRDMRYVSVSRRWNRDYKLGERDVIGLSHYEVFPDISEKWKEIYRRALAGEELDSQTGHFEGVEGPEQWLNWEVRPWYGANGDIRGIVIFTEDITEQKLSKSALGITLKKLRHLNDVLRAIREVSALLNRECDEQRLLNGVCQCLLGARGYVAVWIGRPEEQSGEVKPIAYAGPGACFVSQAPIRCDDGPLGRGPTGTALRERRPVVFDDVASDPRFVPWREPVVAAGAASIASVPLLHRGRLFGVVTVEADRVNAFGPEEVELLSDLAGDVARTLQALEDQGELVAAHCALRDSEVKMRSIFRAAPTGIGLSSNRIMLEVNERLCEMVGYRREELIGKSTRMLYPSEEDYEYVGGEKYRQMREKGTWTVETRFLRKSGDIIDILMSSSPFDPTDLASGVTFTVLDITRQKQDQAELLKLFRHNKLILDTAQEGIVGLDTAGKVTFSNPAAAAVFGYSVEELLGRNLHQLVHHTKPGGELYPESECPMIQALRTGQVFSVRDEILYRKDGAWFHSAYSTSPIEENGAITGAVVTLRDITARRQAEERLTESEKRHRALFENMVSGFVLFEVVQDERGVPVDLIILTANKGFEAISGLKVSGVAGKRLTHVLPGIEKDGADWIGVYGKVALTGEPQQFEKGSELLGVCLSVTAYRAGPGQCCVTFQDITERKRSEEERARVEAQLRQAQKMEALGTLAGGVAHDFNNILNIIMGYTELSKMEIGDGSLVAQNLEEVFAASTRAKELVQQILAFSRRSENRKLSLQPGIVVKEAMKMLRPSLPSTIEIQTEVLGRSLVLADPTQLHQVLMNLCTNAAHAMRDKGGVLEVRLEDRVLGDDEARHYDGLQPGGYVELRVRDTGAGIEPGIIDSIFDPFFTTKKQGEGTGLGLSVVHGIVKSHGGAISVQSTLGEGTAFTVLIPALPENHPHEEKATSHHLPRGHERILVVDDEPVLVKMVGRLLSNLGYEVVTRTGGMEALEILRQRSDAKPFDLVITDMTMPHLTGENLVRELSNSGVAVPVILMTGFSEKIDVEKAKTLGIEGFLMKPIVSKDIAETIRKVLDRQILRDGNLEVLG